MGGSTREREHASSIWCLESLLASMYILIKFRWNADHLRHIDYCMRLVRMLQHNGVAPYLVFDGDYLPSKASTEEERKKSRAKSKAAGIELLNAGKGPLAWKELSKAVDVTPEMAKMLINELKKAGVQYIVAPYEADPQMVYLERKGIVSAILSEDSDLLVFGAKCLLTKLDKYGSCVAIKQEDFCACKDMDLTGWTEKEFRHMAILSGCDYLASVKGVGLLTAYRMMRKYKTAEKVIRMLQFDIKKNVPQGYLESFYRAELTFLHQRVFCPVASTLVHHIQPTQPLDDSTTTFIGIPVDNKVAIRIATGELNPITKKPIAIMDHQRSTSTNSENDPSTPWTLAQKSSQRSFSATGDPRDPNGGSRTSHMKRTPLGELDPNLFTPSPYQQQALLRNSGAWLAVPSPRASQRAVSTPNLRAAAAASTPQSAPPLRAQTSFNAINLGNLSRQIEPQTAQTEPQTEPRPPKRGRLCSDVSEAASPNSPDVERSRFFEDVDSPSVRTTRAASKKHKIGIPVFKDEVVDEILSDGVDTRPNEVTSPRVGSCSVIIQQFEKAEVSPFKAISDAASFLNYSPDEDANMNSLAPVDDNDDSVLIGSGSYETALSSMSTEVVDENAILAFDGKKTGFGGLTPFMQQFSFSSPSGISTPPSTGSRIPVPSKTYGALGAFKKSFGLRQSLSLQPINTNTPRNSTAVTNPLPTPPFTPGTPSYARQTVSFAARKEQPKAVLGSLPFPEVARYSPGDSLPNGEVAGTRYGLFRIEHGKKIYKSRDDIPYELRGKYDRDLKAYHAKQAAHRVQASDEEQAKLDEYKHTDENAPQGQDDTNDVLSSPPPLARRISFGKFAFKG